MNTFPVAAEYMQTVILTGMRDGFRRRFVDALKANHKNIFLSQVLKILEKVYGAEQTLRKQNLEATVFVEKRKKLCFFLFTSLKERLDTLPSEQLCTPIVYNAVS